MNTLSCEKPKKQLKNIWEGKKVTAAPRILPEELSMPLMSVG
jgi:hypothetical protein